MTQQPRTSGALDAFIGRWQVSGEVTTTSPPRTIRFSGLNDVAREADGSMLLARGVTEIEGAAPSTGLAIMVRDARPRRCRVVSISSDGNAGTGVAVHVPERGTWIMRSRTDGPHGRMIWCGRVTFLDAVTKRERWTGRPRDQRAPTIRIEKTERRVDVPPSGRSDLH